MAAEPVTGAVGGVEPASSAADVVMALMFLWAMMGSTDKPAPAGFAPIVGAAIGGLLFRLVAGDHEA